MKSQQPLRSIILTNCWLSNQIKNLIILTLFGLLWTITSWAAVEIPKEVWEEIIPNGKAHIIVKLKLPSAWIPEGLH